MENLKTYTTDVLVIGGGMAGCFAAINAAKSVDNVLLVDKGYVSSSGQTPYANTLLIYNPKVQEKQDVVEYIRAVGDYVVNVGWLDIVLERSMECYEEAKSYGMMCYKAPGETEDFVSGNQTQCVSPDNMSFPQIFRKQVIKSGAKILDKVMIVDL